MDYERKYKDALSRAEEIIKYYKEHNRGDEAAIEDLEVIFPELRESEDEKIRRALLNAMSDYTPDSIVCDGVRADKIIAWLKKQGGQKPQRMISAEAKEA